MLDAASAWQKSNAYVFILILIRLPDLFLSLLSLLSNCRIQCCGTLGWVKHLYQPVMPMAPRSSRPLTTACSAETDVSTVEHEQWTDVATVTLVGGAYFPDKSWLLWCHVGLILAKFLGKNCKLAYPNSNKRWPFFLSLPLHIIANPSIKSDFLSLLTNIYILT